MALVNRFLFLTKYLGLIFAMAILPNNADTGPLKNATGKGLPQGK